ncbi:alginate O-acetyltransferase AlgX-related protein [Roseixanthobacter pseudopolyaromaticivorans]|uniref:alginate O-acetyltransferase AlgX-related protein n=1 Tax=Xanthobacteraceae TaxID=335928 RepID=UPI00372AEFEA
MRAKLHLVYAAAFLLVCFVGMAASLPYLWSEKARAAYAPLTVSTLLNGQFTATFDRTFATGVPHSEALDGAVAGALYAAIGDAGPLVRAGCPGWLFLAEEILEVRNGDTFLAARVRLARKIAADLAKRGVALVVLPVPDKVDLAHDETCGLPVAEQARNRFASWRGNSEGNGLRQANLALNWPTPGFLRTDTHWNTTGAGFAAGQVAAIAKSILGTGTTPVALAEGPVHPRPGDLMRLANLRSTAAIFGPAPDDVRDISATLTRSGGLLDDVPAPAIILAGSSYSLNSGFLEQLQAALAREVVQRSLAGGGFAGAILDLLERHADLLPRTKLVVWEWPVRALTQPLTDAERRYLERDLP